MSRPWIILAMLTSFTWAAPVFSQDEGAGSGASAASENIRGREKWFGQGRRTDREVPAAARDRAFQRKMSLRAVRRAQAPTPNSSATIFSGEWAPLGPAPVISDASGVGLQDYDFVAGRATAVAIDGADPTGNTVYIGGAFGGVWKSTNAGPLSPLAGSVSWSPLTDNQATLAVGSIAIQPQLSNPDPSKSLILVGTGETNGSADSYYGLGILRSADAGNSWTLARQDNSSPPRSFAGLGFGKIAFNTNNPAFVVAAAGATGEGITEAEENPSAVNRGIYYSSDGGLTWHYSLIKDGSAVIDPASVSSVVYNAAAKQFFAAVSLHGIYWSADGITWSRLASQPGSLSINACPTRIASPGICPFYRGEFAVVPGRTGLTGKGEMYAWYVDANDADGGIWTSTDAGASWTQIGDSGITSCGDLFGGCGTAQGAYSLALAAVPDGSATDLYAGAVNLYKCTISDLSGSCGGSGAGAFINLTHVYGCSSIAKVHPAQHAIASLVINNNTQDVMYFANDGGVYRALDGYTGLFSGSCADTNKFDSLNETLGSMTQLVSFSQSGQAQNPTPDILLAGAQANGSPGTASAQNDTAWQNVNAGEGGYTAISPDDDRAWFVSNPPDSVSGVNIFKCGSGAGCHTLDFQNNQIVSGAAVGGDAGAFNTPFILDPQNSAETIVGTCRVWRGPSSGGAFTELSPNFETGGNGICSGDETNIVRSLAAGGALDSNRLSKVIYAGTGGTGPLSSGLPNGGHIWVSKDAGGGDFLWADETGPINPNHFPVSAIVLDNSDISGLTAFAGIMGFGGSHVWKTTSGGVPWTDFNANLPDTPVNALLIDNQAGSNGVLYAATDVGVFETDSVTANWTEVGPPPGSGNPGFLPNVAVTALHIFSPVTGRRLRASTYGRGLWELAGFNLGRPVPNAVTISTPGTSQKVNLLVTAAFAGPVNLSCTVPSWLQCNFVGGGTTLSVNVDPRSPVTVMLTISAAATARGGPVTVGIHAAAAVAGFTTQTQNLPVTVLGGFSFSIVNLSGSPTVAPGQAATYDLSVVPSAGTFPAAVALSFSGCPAASVCSLSTSQVAAGSAATSAVLTVATASSTPPGVYSSISVSGALVGASSQNASVNLSLTVQAGAFSFSMSSSGPGIITSGSSGQYDIKVKPSAGTFPNPVALTFSGCPAASTCTLSATQVPAGSGTTEVFLTVATTAATPFGVYTMTTMGSSGSLTASTTTSFTVQTGSFSFSMSSSGPATIKVGSSATYDIAVTPSVGTFPNPVALTFTGCPAVSTCSPSSTQVPAGSGLTHVSLVIATTPPALNSQKGALLYGSLLLLISAGSPRLRRSLGTIVVALLVALFLTGCGGLQGGAAAPAGNPGTPVGVYTVTVIGTSGALTAQTKISLTVQSAQ